VIRALRNSDADGLAALFSGPKFRAGTLRLPYQSVDSVRKFVEGRLTGDLSLIAEHEGRVVGTFMLSRFIGRRQHVADFWMGVADELDGQGIGTALLAEALSVTDRWLNIARLELTVYADNVRAIKLYEKFGFEIEGKLRMYAFRDGDFADALLMARIKDYGTSGKDAPTMTAGDSM